MFGITLNWTCTDCKKDIHDELGITSYYKVEGYENDFCVVECNKCRKKFFVGDSGNIVISAEEIGDNFEESHVVCW